MSTNKSALLPRTTEKTSAQMHINELAYIVLLKIRYGLLPCACLFGIMGNVTSIVILTRQGFRKCSNVILLYLAVSEILFMIGMNDFLLYLYNEKGAFLFSETGNYICYILDEVFVCCYLTAVFPTVVIPVLITGERILVIVWPFKANLILTPRRAVIVLSSLYVVGGMHFIKQDLMMFEFKQLAIKGGGVAGLIRPTDMFVNQIRSGVFYLIEDIYNYFTGAIPISLVAVGCAVIGIKITQISNRRRHLISSQVKATTKHGITKTTKTLLSICVLYIVCNSVSFSYGFLIQIHLRDFEGILRDVAVEVINLIYCFNFIGDFLIYINANSSFKKPIILNQRLRNALSYMARKLISR